MFLVELERNAVWFSTMHYMIKKTPAELTQNRFQVNFKDEQGIDAGFLFFHIDNIF